MSAGRFEITEILGAGAYAVVCVAVDADTGSQVALKILRKESRNDVDAVDRLRDEARILMALRHPNIPAVTELLDYDGRPVVVMEHVRGVACDVLRKAIGEALTPGMVLQLAGQVAVGLDYAWNTPDADEPMRIVHRDLKPSNVVLSQDGVVKIIDFGIAKGSFDGRAAKSLFVVHGSQGYEAPERWLGVGEG